MNRPSPFGEVSIETFLQRYWQREPLMVRGAIAATEHTPPGRDALIAAAIEGAPARLVVVPGREQVWSVHRQPFRREDFERLPATGWTLLVQETDRLFDGCRRLQERFRFIPNWRTDDVMTSYAADGAGVGPHVDRYDVVLYQAAGRRRWRIESVRRQNPALRNDTALPLLEQFAPDREWILEPGDLLYLPAGIPHDGIALGESITCSVGFRTPDLRELVSGFVRELSPADLSRISAALGSGLEAGSDADSGTGEQRTRGDSRPGEISGEDRAELRATMRRVFADDAALDRWIARFVTQPRRGLRAPDRRVRHVDELRRLLDDGQRLQRSATAHFSWYEDDAGNTQLFVGGERYELGATGRATAELLCGSRPLEGDRLAPLLTDALGTFVLLDLIARGYLRAVAPSGD